MLLCHLSPLYDFQMSFISLIDTAHSSWNTCFAVLIWERQIQLFPLKLASSNAFPLISILFTFHSVIYDIHMNRFQSTFFFIPEFWGCTQINSKVGTGFFFFIFCCAVPCRSSKFVFTISASHVVWGKWNSVTQRKHTILLSSLP